MNQNVGHGHVFPRPDGVRARCGGPALCRECARDLARRNAVEAKQPIRSPADWQDFVVWEGIR